MRPWPLTIELGGEDYEVPALPAADWLYYLMRKEPDVDGLLDELLPDLEDLLLDGVVDIDEVYDMTLDLITTVCARPWWVALRLISVARSSWDILGPDLIKRNLDPNRHSLAAWLDVALVSILNNMEPKDTTMFTLRLEAEPRLDSDEPGPAPIDSMEMDRGAFLAMGMN